MRVNKKWRETLAAYLVSLVLVRIQIFQYTFLSVLHLRLVAAFYLFSFRLKKTKEEHLLRPEKGERLVRCATYSGRSLVHRPDTALALVPQHAWFVWVWRVGCLFQDRSAP